MRNKSFNISFRDLYNTLYKKNYIFLKMQIFHHHEQKYKYNWLFYIEIKQMLYIWQTWCLRLYKKLFTLQL